MNTRLLKINAMKRFCRWANMTGNHGTIANFFPIISIKEIEHIIQRQQDIHERDHWFVKRKKAIVSWERGSIADSLLNYIKKRRERKE